MAAIIAMLCSLFTAAMAAPPDLTAGGTIPSNLTTTWNLGPTGMRGWFYYDTTSGGINGSVESRQIQVRKVDAGSPAAGVFLPDDLILGASGTAAAPALFDIDARRGLATAIADAEARTPAHLKLIRWRDGAQSVVTLTLRTMGAYSATAPYNCPKSEAILREGMDYYYNRESSGRYRMGVLSLLAAQDDFFPDRALYLQKAQTEARGLIKNASTLSALRNYTASTVYAAPWERVHELIVLGEYYLITGDTQVFPTIEALAINLAKGASHYGTMGHSLRPGYDPSNSYRPVSTGYGVVNSIGMPCLVGVQLAKQCGVEDPVVDQMIDRAKMFYASYANRGAIPYGEHEAYDPGHENNGKSGLAAIVLDNDPAYEDQAKFFAMMALASGATDRDMGHTGAFFNYLWAPMGVQRGGPSAVQEYFKKINWQLDLHRRWDKGFDYDSYIENIAPNGSEYYGFRMSTAMLLTYALPLESLHITGRDSTGALALSPEQISDCIDVEDYDATARTTPQLVADLGVWSPKIRRLVSVELGKRTINTSTRNEIRAKAMDVNGGSRYGAIQTLGQVRDTGFTGELVSLLNDDDAYVRTLAAKALHLFHGSHKVPYRADMMQTLVSRDRPTFPTDPGDPLQLDQAALTTAIFGGGAFANNRSEMDTLISQVGSQLFFDALKVASRQPTGYARGRINNLYKVLTPAEVNLMAPELVDMVALEPPADRMFVLGVRNEAMLAMARSLVADAVPAAMQAMDNSNGWGGFHDNLLNGLIGYGGASTLVTPDPDVVAFAERYRTGGTTEKAQALLDAIAADTNPAPPFEFKSINSATADDPTVDITANSTVLRVTATDLAEGDSIFTWRKLSGPGEVSFSPNGTDATASTVLFDGTPGTYQFEVTMSDSRGLTEAYGTVTVQLTSAPPLNLILNPGFENGTQADADPRFTFAELDHWSNNGVDDNAIGAIDNDARSGTYRGSLFATTRIPYQITNHVIRGGETMTLDFWHIGKSGWEAGDTIEAELFYLDEGGAVQVLAGATFQPQVDVWQRSNHLFPALEEPSAIGMPLGIRFRSNVGTGRFASIDDILLATTGDSGGDTTPPTPNPAGFASPPAAISSSAITMTATTASDPSGPVQYLFTETSGNPGGTSSGWQTDASYTDTGLNPDTTYSYTVTTRDALGNTGTPSAAASATTSGTGGPAGPLVGQLGILDLTANGGINPATGLAWAEGDTYHLAFVTSGTRNATDPDIATYHAFVQAAADAAGLGGVTWYCIAQTWNHPTRNTNAPPMSSSASVFLADGATKLADSGAALAGGTLAHPFSITEIETTWSGAVATGSNRMPGDPNQDKIEHGVSWAADGRWWQQFNGAQTNQWRWYAISEPLTVIASVATNPYATWAATHAPAGGPADDFDGDGVPNAIEFVLGGGMDTNDHNKLPVVTTDGTDMTFTFVRDQDSVDASVSVEIEVGTDLVNWPEVFRVGADTASSTPGVTVVDNLDGTDTVTHTIPLGEDARKFVRLKVGVAP